MKKEEDLKLTHPNPLDRNRSILLSRDLLEMKDWVAVAFKHSTQTNRRVIPGDSAELVSISVLGPDSQVLMDVLVRPDGAVNSDLLKQHGCDPAHAFNAPLFSETHKILTAGFAKARVLCFDAAKLKDLLSRLCAKEKLPEIEGRFVDIKTEYSRFVGEINPVEANYKQQELPDAANSALPEVSPLRECQQILAFVREMASSSQINDSALPFNKQWSAAFYRPKLGPAEKLKEMLGFND